RVLNPGELSGLAKDKSLEGALSRVENRVAYEMINDLPDLAAAYAEAISQGHCFNDANKRTAFRSMQMCLALNGAQIKFDTVDAGDRIIALAQGKTHGDAIADWIRTKT
ncbi:MAG: type II toxin-antitoxin system death-on-curing family toxin, partial [Planktomarina sp.]